MNNLLINNQEHKRNGLEIEKIVQGQILWLRLLPRLDSNIQVSLTGKSKWTPLFNVIKIPPNAPISARSILKNKLVLEIDDDSWYTVRNGSLKIANLLKKCVPMIAIISRILEIEVFTSKYFSIHLP